MGHPVPVNSRWTSRWTLHPVATLQELMIESMLRYIPVVGDIRWMVDTEVKDIFGLGSKQWQMILFSKHHFQEEMSLRVQLKCSSFH